MVHYSNAGQRNDDVYAKLIIGTCGAPVNWRVMLHIACWYTINRGTNECSLARRIGFLGTKSTMLVGTELAS